MEILLNDFMNAIWGRLRRSRVVIVDGPPRRSRKPKTTSSVEEDDDCVEIKPRFDNFLSENSDCFRETAPVQCSDFPLYGDPMDVAYADETKFGADVVDEEGTIVDSVDDVGDGDEQDVKVDPAAPSASVVRRKFVARKSTSGAAPTVMKTGNTTTYVGRRVKQEPTSYAPSSAPVRIRTSVILHEKRKSVCLLEPSFLSMLPQIISFCFSAHVLEQLLSTK